MIFTFTFSQDETTDIVMKELDTNDVLRFNIDKPDDFAWDFHPEIRLSVTMRVAA